MFDSQLFLGFPLSDSYQQELNQLPDATRTAFIQPQSSLYLQQIKYEGQAYLGKCLGSSIELALIDSLQGHIYSLLKKLIPIYPYEQYPLVFLAFN